MTITNNSIRNVAIIAHVDHGKTTLVDAMFKQSGVFRAGQQVDERVMDRMDIERERGITIAAKNCAVHVSGVKINIIDTPGHADFGGEVERALFMAGGAILLVDASEGPLPQTRFVLRKALEANLPIILVINKIDRGDARPQAVLGEVYDLFIDLGAEDSQLEFPVLYAIGKRGAAWDSLEAATSALAEAEKTGDELTVSLAPLFEAILKHLPGPSYDPDEAFQMLVTDLDYSDYLGRLAVGRIMHGTLHTKDALVCMDEKGQANPLRATKLQVYDGIKLSEVEEAAPGDIVVLAGIENVSIGDTVCTRDNPRVLPRIRVDEPTVAMRFSINTSPLAGQEGKIVQSRAIRDRLHKESLRNVAVQVEDSEGGESFVVKGRGELQMAILVETMRREGFELCVGRPEVILKKDASGSVLEPIEDVYVDCDESSMGIVTEKLATRKGRMTSCINNGSGRVRLEFSVPARGLVGYRDEFLTDTRGSGIMNSSFAGHEPWRGDFLTRFTGSLVADRSGHAVAYAIFNLEPRGALFVVPGDPIYEGMIVGEHNRENDIDINPSKEKKLTNMRAAGKDENVILTPVKPMTLERAIHFVREDEMVEVTPKSIRLRKTELSAQRRGQMAGQKKKAKLESL